MSQVVGKTVNYVCTEFPKSREFYRLTRGVVNTLQDLQIGTIFGANLEPIGQLAKGLDGAFYGKKALEDLDTVRYSFRSYNRANHKESLYNLFSATVRLAGNAFASLKWLGTFGGIVILSPYAKSFGYIKNMCAVYAASINISTNGQKIYTKYRSTDADKKEEMAKATALVVISLCSIWLNGMGGLDSYVGKATFAEKGVQGLQPWTFNSAVIISNMTAVAKNIAEA